MNKIISLSLAALLFAPLQAMAQWGVGDAAKKQAEAIEKTAQAAQQQAQAKAAGDPLTKSDLDNVLNWIGERVSAQQQPFCYKQSYGRGAGYPLTTCDAGQQKNGALCYPQCRAGYGGAGPVCWGYCPSGYIDMGATCHINKALVVTGTTSCAHWYEPWTCHTDCPSGYTNGGLCYLNKINLPPGFSGSWMDPMKPTYTRGAGTPLKCAPGLEQNGALCYPRCNSGFYGVGPVCWESCPSGLTDCGAGCASGKTSCASSVSNMVISPIMVAVNIAALVVTAGAASGVTAEADEGVEAGVKGSEEAAAAAQEATAAAKEAGTLDKFASKIQSAWKDYAAGVRTKADLVSAGELWKAATTGNKALVALKFGAKGLAVGLMIDKWVKDADANFSSLTTPAVSAALDNAFRGHPKSEDWVKTQYALVNLSQMAPELTQQTVNTAISTAGLVDPTGVTGVVAAYDNPKCTNNDPFPTVRILNQD